MECVQCARFKLSRAVTSAPFAAARSQRKFEADVAIDDDCTSM